MTPERARLADRILKLLALAQGTSFEAEADSARRMAEALMARHNISADEGAKDRDKFAAVDVLPHFKGARWEFMLLSAVAKLCGCKAYWFGDFEEFTVAGRTPDIEACHYIWTKLQEQRIAAWLLYKVSGADPFHRFCYAYADGVAMKVGALLAHMPAVRIATTAADAWFKAQHEVVASDLRLGAAKSRAGLDAGRRASLHRGELGGDAPQRRIR